MATTSVLLQPGCFPLLCGSLPPEYLLSQSFGAAAAGGNQHLKEVVALLGRYRGCPCEEKPLTGAGGGRAVGVSFPGGSHRGLVNAAEA